MEVQIFDNKAIKAHVRSITLGDEPWFVAADVCAALGMSTDHVRGILDEDEVMDLREAESIHSTNVPNGDQSHFVQLNANNQSHFVQLNAKDGTKRGRSPLIISESGLYHLIFVSRKPAAKEFRRWVTRVVLPAIREAGRFDRNTNQLALPRYSEGRRVYLAVNDMLDKLEEYNFDLHYVCVIGQCASRLAKSMDNPPVRFGLLNKYHTAVWDRFFEKCDTDPAFMWKYRIGK